jgi:hypothetical protein
MNKIVDPGIYILDSVFPDEHNIDKSKLQMTSEGVYSVTGKEGAKFICKIIYKNMKKNKNIIITDTTGNNGSDTLMLAKFFKQVNSIEIDDINYLVLKNNINIYNYTNINLIKGNAIIELDNTTQDVIFIDAPWGGRQYKNTTQLKLYLDNLELSDILNKFRKKAKLFVLKIPVNYDINNLLLTTQTLLTKIYAFRKNERIKFFIMVIKI